MFFDSNVSIVSERQTHDSVLVCPRCGGQGGVCTCGGRAVNVDAKIADAVSMFIRKGFPTKSSCEGGMEEADFSWHVFHEPYLVFASMDAVKTRQVLSLVRNGIFRAELEAVGNGLFEVSLRLSRVAEDIIDRCSGESYSARELDAEAVCQEWRRSLFEAAASVGVSYAGMETGV